MSPVDDRIIKALGELGVKANESRAYLALLHHGPGTAAEVADAAGIARPKVYEALKALEQHGFCTVEIDRVARFKALAPELALGEWTRRRAHHRTMLTRQDERLAEELRRALPEPGGTLSGETGGYMDARVGAAETLAMIREIISHAVNRVDIIISLPVIQARRERGTFEIEALKRGLRLRVILAAELAGGGDDYRALQEAGGEIRVADQLPLKMVVRDDGAEAVVALVDESDGGYDAMSVMIRHPELAAPFQLLFNRQWRRASELDLR